MNAVPTIGFIGLGTMGWPMARNLARAGNRVAVADREAARRDAFADEHGCAAAAQPSDFAAAECVVTMLPTGRIVRDVLVEQDGGVARNLADGCVLVDMGSSDPTGTRALGDELAGHGLTLVDAPVSGGAAKAETGELSIMLGGDDSAATDRAADVVGALAARIFRTGPLGSGHALKALNNYVAAAGFTAAAEALVVGKRFGLDPNVLVDVLNASTGRNFSTEYTLQEHVLPGSFATGFSLGLMAKDVELAADLADAMEIPAPLCHAVRERLDGALAELDGESDHSLAVMLWDDA